MNTITIAELRKRLDAEPGLALLDVRTPLEFSEVHAAGAFNVPLDELRPSVVFSLGRLKKDQPAYILCRTGNRAAKAAKKFAEAGFENAVVVEGGTVAWEEAGLPVNRSGIKVISIERQVRIVAGSLVVTGVVLGWLVHPGFFGLAGFVGTGLVFAGVTDFCGMGLLLARLPYNKRFPAARSSPPPDHGS